MSSTFLVVKGRDSLSFSLFLFLNGLRNWSVGLIGLDLSHQRIDRERWRKQGETEREGEGEGNGDGDA